MVIVMAKAMVIKMAMAAKTIVSKAMTVTVMVRVMVRADGSL